MANIAGIKNLTADWH